MTNDERRTKNNDSSPYPLLPSPFSFLLSPYSLLLLFILLFALYFGALAVQQHRAYLTNGLDVGNVDQALWNTAHGRFLDFTLMAPVTNRLALHVEPILLAFVPAYRLGFGGPELLLAVQALVVALGAWPLYQIAIANYQSAMNTEQFAAGKYALLVVPLAYLLLPTLQSAALFDFHAVTLAPTFLLFAFLALERRQNAKFWLFAALAMACKEDMPLVVAMLGLYAGLARRRWRFAGAVVAAAALWFAGAVLVIQPLAAAGGNIQLDRYAWLGDSPAQMATTLFTQPGLVFDHLWNQADLPGYLAALLFPTAFLALFSPLTLLPALPPLAVNLLSQNPFTWRLEDFHYGAPLAPFLLISAAYGATNLARWLARRQSRESANPQATSGPRIFHAVLLILLLTFSAVYQFHRGYTPLSRAFAWPAKTDHHRQLDALLRDVPTGAPLFAQSNLAPHLSQRPVIYADFGLFTDPDFPAAVPVQDVLLDVSTLENIGGLHQFLQDALFNGDYQLVAARDGILHLRRAPAPVPPPDLPPEFTGFAYPDSAPDIPLTANFGDAVRLRGYSLHFNRQEEVQVSVDLEPLRPLADIQPVLYLLDATGQPQGAAADLQPAQVWLPPEQWPVGQTVRLRFNTLPWYTRDTARYRLALGVMQGRDPWAESRRLRPDVAPDTPLAVRLPAGESLLELAEISQVWQMPGGGPRSRQFHRPTPPQPLAASFAGQLELFGVSAPHISGGDAPVLTLDLYWQAQAAPEPLVRFVQLVGPDGQLVGQIDSAPDGGQYATNRWQPGEVVVERVSFPVAPERPPGSTTLHIGLYRPQTGERLLLQSGGDHVEIGPPD